MGDINQMLFLQRHKALFQGPYLEVGSKDYGSTQNFRAIFCQDGTQSYTGIDMESGPGVDLVLDLTRPQADIDEALGHRRFKSIFCLSVLEHCADPFKMARALTELLEPGGRIFLSVPFTWQFHGYPSDYWRFTHEGIKVLFSELSFAPELGNVATSRKGDFLPLDTNLGKIPMSFKWHRQHGHWFRGLVVKFARMVSHMGFLAWLFDYRYLMPPTSIFMIGEKTGHGTQS